MEGKIMVDSTRRGLLTGRWGRSSAEISPPWSTRDGDFLAHCTRCNACIDACETQILQPGAGGYPVLNFTRGECLFCYACADACPQPLFRPRRTRPWQLLLTISRECLTRKGVECRSCQENCEPLAITFPPVISGISPPHLTHQHCHGCGACIASCPVSAITLEYTRDS